MPSGQESYLRGGGDRQQRLVITQDSHEYKKIIHHDENIKCFFFHV